MTSDSTPSRQLILCPGFMTDRALWSRMERGLNDLGNCTFADLSGTDDLAAAARDILADAPDRFSLIGFSLGGFVAREIVRIAPDRVRGLVLMNSSARPGRPQIIERNKALVRITKERGFRGLSPAAVKKALHPDRRGDAALVQEILDMGTRMGEQAFLNQLAIDRPDDRPHLSEISCPTLVIWSRQDELRHLDEVQEMADAIPNARMEIIEDCGHMTPMEAPDEVLDLISEWVLGVAI